MGKGTKFSRQPVEKRGFHETLRNGFDHDKPFLSETYGTGRNMKNGRKKAEFFLGDNINVIEIQIWVTIDKWSYFPHRRGYYLR